MSEPIVFISRFRIKPGRQADFEKHYRESLPPIEAGKPDTLVQLAYVNEDQTEVSVVRVFPSADGLDLQLQGSNERSKKTYQFIEPLDFEIYGAPGSFAMEMFKKVAGSGIPVNSLPIYLGGFIRLKSE